MTTSDFVDVQLTAAASALKSVRIANAHFDYTFGAGVPTRVLTSEWRAMLSRKTFQGAPVLEVAPPAPAPAPAQPKPSKAAAPVIAADNNEVK